MNRNMTEIKTFLATALICCSAALCLAGEQVEAKLLIKGAEEGSMDGNGVLFSVNPDDDGFQWIEADGKKIAEGTSLLPVPGTSCVVYLSPGIFPDVILRDNVSGKETAILKNNPIDSPLFVLSDGRIVWIDENGKTVAYDVKKNQVIDDFPALPTNTIALSPDGKIVAVSTEGNGVRSLNLVSAADGKTIAELPFPPRQGTIQVGGRHSPSFSPDGKFLVLIRAGIQPEADVELYEIAAGKLSSLTSDHAEYRLPRFSADGKSVLAGSVNGLVQLIL